MLRRFLYLDRTALRQYSSMIDGGLASSSTVTQTRGGEDAVRVDAKLVGGQKGWSREDQESKVVEDTDEARFDRLMSAAALDAERLGWIDVLDPDADLDRVGVGAVISWECDVWIPPASEMLSSTGEAAQALRMMRSLAPSASALGMAIPGLPDDSQLEAMQRFVEGAEGKAVLVGEADESTWKFVAPLDPSFRDGDLDGYARVVGKVSKVVPEGRWQPLLTLPGMNLMPRAERRALQSKAPEPGQEDQYVAGPLVVLDLLAVFR